MSSRTTAFGLYLIGLCPLVSCEDSGSYSGVVIAAVNQSGTTTTNSVFANFKSGPPFAIESCPNLVDASSGSCCCSVGSPQPMNPVDAGRVTVKSAGLAGAVATLAPVNTQPVGPYYYTQALGLEWRSILGDYPPVEDALPWKLHLPWGPDYWSAWFGTSRFRGFQRTAAMRLCS